MMKVLDKLGSKENGRIRYDLTHPIHGIFHVYYEYNEHGNCMDVTYHWNDYTRCESSARIKLLMEAIEKYDAENPNESR